jgi:hypothetical protein
MATVQELDDQLAGLDGVLAETPEGFGLGV